MPLLATPLGVLPLPGAELLNRELVPLLRARAANDKSKQRNPLCYQSAEDLLEWPEPPLRELVRLMFGGVYAFVTALNELSAEEIASLRIEARGRFILVRQDGCLAASSYPMTAWCAMYCVAVPPPSTDRLDSGLLRFYESRMGTMFQDATNAAMRLPYRHGHCGWQPAAGALAIFPGSQAHEIATVRANGELILVTLRVRFVGPEQTGVAHW